MPLSDDIEGLLTPTIEGLGYELLCLEFVEGGKDLLLRLYIDGPDGINIDDCTRVSRAVSRQFEIDDPIPGAYRLEVSSPGWDRPLVKPAHFAAFMGHEAKVKTPVPIDGRRNFRGRIVAVDEAGVHLAMDDATMIFPLSDIERARLVPESGPQGEPS